MTPKIEPFIVRIRSEKSKDAPIYGAGFLVSENKVLTCAHVITDALGLPRDTSEMPTKEVYLDFPLLAPNSLLKAHAIYWVPVLDGDIAELKLDDDPPGSAQPARLVTADDFLGHEAWVLGFPAGHDKGKFVPAQLQSKITGGWLQIAGKDTFTSWVKEGFSGAPVWDNHPEINGVIGMIVAYEKELGVKEAYVIPADFLVDKLPELSVSHPEKNHSVTIIIDQSHKQDKWYDVPTASAGYKAAFESLSKLTSLVENGHDFDYEINYENKLENNFLSSYDILIFPTPWGTIVGEDEYEGIAKWVADGHGLLVFGTYLNEDHIYTNINRLVRRFGFRFDYNLIMPLEKHSHDDCMEQAFYGYQLKDLWVRTKLIGVPQDHAILNGVEELEFVSSSTIEPADHYELLVSTQSICNIMKAEGPRNENGKLYQILKYYIDKQTNAPFMIAVRYGAGKVVGIGSWKIFLNDFINDNSTSNKKLFNNIIIWLAH